MNSLSVEHAEKKGSPVVNLKGARAVVTGGSSGIGRWLAVALAQRGVSVVIVGRNEQKLVEAANAIPGAAYAVCDIARGDQVVALAKRMKQEGGTDLLINCAGVMHFFDAASGYPVEKQNQEVDIDVLGPVRMVHAFLPDLIERKSVLVNVSSGLAWVPFVGAPIYSGSKAFVHAWTIALREQLRSHSVRVVELLPPVVDTPLAKNLDPSFSRMAPEVLARDFIRGLQSGRDEIAPGLSTPLKWMSRLAPGLILRQLNKDWRNSL